MEQQLILNRTIYGNLRRTLKRHLLSSKSVFQINDLALKYFGIYNDAGELIGYQCPYSGEKITSTKKIVLEHIIPVNSGGGTVLFNCIPTSKEVNMSGEKGQKHLIEWWVSSRYWNQDAPKRLEKLVQYILDSYEIILNQKEMEIDTIDIEEFDDVSYDQVNDDEVDLTTTQEEEQQVESVSLISYYCFINDALNELKKHTDISSYQFRLKTLVGQNIFGNIERQVKIQEFLKEFIKNKFEFEDRTELGFVLNIDIDTLTKSLEKYSDNEMFLELERRINNIERILDDNNLSLYSFFEDRNVLNYLNKSIEKITSGDINNLINNINICVRDRFNKFIDFVSERNGVLPRKDGMDENERKLGNYRGSIQKFSNRRKFEIVLLKDQLLYLHDSKYERLREIYKKILYKIVEMRIVTGDNSIKIDYEDLDMVVKIEEYLGKRKGKMIEEQIELERQYKDYIVVDSQFNEFIGFVFDNNGKLPCTNKLKDETEKKLGNYKDNMQRLNNRGNFDIILSREQLLYLHDSKYERLREIYKKILYKIVEMRIVTGDNSIKIDYEDLDMVVKIQEYLGKRKGKTMEEQIILDVEYRNYIVVKNKFCEFIGFVFDHNGILPSAMSKDETEKELGRFRNSMINFNYNFGRFNTMLSKEQLLYLHDSKYERLREIYKKILYKIVEKRIELHNNDIKIDYEDSEMVVRIEEYLGKRKGKTIEEQIKLDVEYRDYIVVKNKFCEFIGFVFDHNGILPSTMSKDETEEKLGAYRQRIQKFTNKGKIETSLSKDQLKYLHDSRYESLREIYEKIMKKAYINNYDEYIEFDKEIKQETDEIESRNYNDSESSKKGRIA